MRGFEAGHTFEGVVAECRGGMYLVEASRGGLCLCTTYRGTKTDNVDTTLVAVGDRVSVTVTAEGDTPEGVIAHVRLRRTALMRKRDVRRNRSKEKIQVIAANIDQLAIVVSAEQPPLNRRLIDRYLVFAESEKMPVIIIVNKMDLAEPDSVSECMRPYDRLGYTVCYVSAENGKGLAGLRDELDGKVTVLSGHSGVGKSTVINRLVGEEKLKTAEISAWSLKGVHTTTNAVMLGLPCSGYVIDTPGLREFSLSDITKDNLRFYFPEFLVHMQTCAFSSCTHTVEPGCGVACAVDTGAIDRVRYESYLAIFDSLPESEQF
ncbi:MAG: ribosome small subunit-dependent GTPase A [Chlorobium phaeobacteroides]|uniref:Small ribosomal subunit biogenesis GTPase RsgA n=1 Tax=Chlorobium phaeobacteroides (strain BS1) TaxID=331678 RepID=B3EMX9_CHLPB|nr:ribosome small subunit-dependent GTPase A [Chlorobium phaeobacteroides]